MTQPAPNSTVPDKGLVARAIGILTSPKATFETIVAYPRPAVFLLFVCLLLGVAQGAPQFTEKGRQAALDMQVKSMEGFGMQVKPEVYEAMEKRMAYNGYITVVSMFVFVPIAVVFFSALYWVLFNAVLGGTASFKQVLGITAHSGIIGAIGALISAPIMYAQGVLSTAGPFNLGALVPFLAPENIIAKTLGATSMFQVWGMFVTGIGLGVLYRRKGSTIGLALIAFYLIITACVFTVFSAFASR